MMTKDCKGRRINKGDIIRHGKHTGKVKDDDFDGLWCQLSNGLKIRLSDWGYKVTIVKRGVIHG